MEFNIRASTWKEVHEVYPAVRATSAPGPKIIFNVLMRLMESQEVRRVSGCLKHNGVITQLITNAYDSVPHKLVEASLDQHHVPNQIKDLIREGLGIDESWLKYMALMGTVATRYSKPITIRPKVEPNTKLS